MISTKSTLAAVAGNPLGTSLTAKYLYDLSTLKKIEGYVTAALIKHHCHKNFETMKQDILSKIATNYTYDVKLGALSTWVYRIVNNHVIDEHRKRNSKERSKTALTSFIDHEDSDLSLGEIYELNTQHATYQENHFDTEVQNMTLRTAVERLAPMYQQLIQARYFDELKYEEIAEKFDLPLGTLKAQLFRAKAQLHEVLSTSATLSELEYRGIQQLPVEAKDMTLTKVPKLISTTTLRQQVLPKPAAPIVAQSNRVFNANKHVLNNIYFVLKPYGFHRKLGKLNTRKAKYYAHTASIAIDSMFTFLRFSANTTRTMAYQLIRKNFPDIVCRQITVGRIKTLCIFFNKEDAAQYNIAMLRACVA